MDDGIREEKNTIEIGIACSSQRKRRISRSSRFLRQLTVRELVLVLLLLILRFTFAAAEDNDDFISIFFSSLRMPSSVHLKVRSGVTSSVHQPMLLLSWLERTRRLAAGRKGPSSLPKETPVGRRWREGESTIDINL
jgi:hypothetical protein